MHSFTFALLMAKGLGMSCRRRRRCIVCYRNPDVEHAWRRCAVHRQAATTSGTVIERARTASPRSWLHHTHNELTAPVFVSPREAITSHICDAMRMCMCARVGKQISRH